MKKYFHATSFQSAQKIKVEGFRLGKDGMFGGGIYFSEKITSAVRKARSPTIDSVIIVNLNIGRLITERIAHNDWNLQKIRSLGYDSVQMTNCRTGSEICVYEPSRIKILDIIQWKDEIVYEIVLGHWGNGLDRRTKLEKSGHNYDSIQDKVNNYYGIAKDVIKGIYGNGEKRKKIIEEKGFNYYIVQHIVNEMMGNH